MLPLSRLLDAIADEALPGFFADLDVVRWPSILFGLSAIVFVVQLLPGASSFRLTYVGLFRNSRFIMSCEGATFVWLRFRPPASIWLCSIQAAPEGTSDG